jgi:3-phenylpropionate/cinnamic acid dioxygenase small subunit
VAAENHEIESFLYREAQFMDEHKYDEWLSLWTDDALYWIPCNRDDVDPTREVSIIYDDRASLEDRLHRLKGPSAHAQDPKSRLRRLISNIEVKGGGDGEWTVHSNFILVELRRGKQDIFAGRTIHRLRCENGSLKIAYKKVLLVNNDDVIDNLTFLI